MTARPPWEVKQTHPTLSQYLTWHRNQAAPGQVIDEELLVELYSFEFGSGEGDVIKGEEEHPSMITALFGKTSLILQEKRKERRAAARMHRGPK